MPSLLTDLLTLQEAQEAINTTAIATSELERSISAVSQAIDAHCGPVVAREVTEIHAGGERTLWLYQAPALSITSVTEFDGTTQTALVNESAFGTVGGSLGYALINGRLERRSGGSLSTFGTGQVRVVYQAGRATTTAAVSPKFKMAASNILRRVWKREGSAWAYSADFFANTDEQSVSAGAFFRAVAPMVDEWLWDERRRPQIA